MVNGKNLNKVLNDSSTKIVYSYDSDLLEPFIYSTKKTVCRKLENSAYISKEKLENICDEFDLNSIASKNLKEKNIEEFLLLSDYIICRVDEESEKLEDIPTFLEGKLNINNLYEKINSKTHGNSRLNKFARGLIRSTDFLGYICESIYRCKEKVDSGNTENYSSLGFKIFANDLKDPGSRMIYNFAGFFTGVIASIYLSREFEWIYYPMVFMGILDGVNALKNWASKDEFLENELK